MHLGLVSTPVPLCGLVCGREHAVPGGLQGVTLISGIANVMCHGVRRARRCTISLQSRSHSIYRMRM